MSGINGDKARFNRQRKQKIARRARDAKFFHSVTAGQKPAAAAPQIQSSEKTRKQVSA